MNSKLISSFIGIAQKKDREEKEKEGEREK